VALVRVAVSMVMGHLQGAGLAPPRVAPTVSRARKQLPGRA
jgi:hypothetical protein